MPTIIDNRTCCKKLKKWITKLTIESNDEYHSAHNSTGKQMP